MKHIVFLVLSPFAATVFRTLGRLAVITRAVSGQFFGAAGCPTGVPPATATTQLTTLVLANHFPDDPGLDMLRFTLRTNGMCEQPKHHERPGMSWEMQWMVNGEPFWVFFV
mmetsp:Transcript_97136/g.163392  ORF Transcript_97136/g.163392 Transcript_97136/m.163392 type:complete len:111 (-) Transcript_97136:60-392(-)